MITDFLTSKPATKRELASKSGYPVREVELLIHAARLEGVPIVSNSDGYWLSSDPAEILACADRLRHRYVTQAVTARALKRTATRLSRPKEMTLWP